jgi:hypothetical protein
MGRLVHTGLGSSSLVAHVLHYPPPHTTNANSFIIGTAVINTHTANPAAAAAEEEEEKEEDLFVFNDTKEGPRVSTVKTGRITQAQRE